jgi:hypothetical protein
MIPGRVDRGSRFIQPEDCTLDAQQLRQAPTPLAALAPRERLVDCLVCFIGLPGNRHTFSEHAERQCVAQSEAGLTKPFESASQQR